MVFDKFKRMVGVDDDISPDFIEIDLNDESIKLKS